jgi:hypothetical protein
VDTFSLGDRRREEQRIDAVLRARPDLILIAGGTDGGAQEALLKLVETVTLACHLLPTDSQTKVLYAGNQALQEKVAETLASVASVHNAPNLQPELGQEVLAPARLELARVFEDVRLAQVGGFAPLAQAAGGRILPTAQAEGQIVRFLSRKHERTKGVLGVHVGSASTSVAAAFKGDLHLAVRPDLGVGVHAPAILAEEPLEHFTRWLPFEISEADVRDFIFDKAAHPHTIPEDVRDLHLEQALARQVLQAGLRRARSMGWPGPRGDLLSGFDLILGCGAVLSRAPRPGSAALVLLDALQPVGITSLGVDPYHLAAALGAAAYVNPIAVAQVLEAGALLNLGLAVSVTGRARPGEVVCQARLVAEGGTELSQEVRFGTLEVLSLPYGQSARLTLKPRAGMDVGFGPGRSRTLPVAGSAVGVIIDARGRPIVFPGPAAKRHEAVQHWHLKVAGV